MPRYTARRVRCWRARILDFQSCLGGRRWQRISSLDFRERVPLQAAFRPRQNDKAVHSVRFRTEATAGPLEFWRTRASRALDGLCSGALRRVNVERSEPSLT